jgi:hypothetical protein
MFKNLDRPVFKQLGKTHCSGRHLASMVSNAQPIKTLKKTIKEKIEKNKTPQK